MMNRSFYNGISGIKTHQFGIDTWADNIANQNMFGFKENLPEFENLFSQTMAVTTYNPSVNDMGLGSDVQRTSLDLSTGELIDSDRNFDTAIDGHGWYGFIGNKQTYYTKLGSFHRDVDGNLVNDNGEYLLGTSNDSVKLAKLSDEKLQSFGQAYTKKGLENPKIYTVDLDEDTPLANVKSQGKIKLPDLLYIPAKPTKHLTFGANLNNEVESQIDPTTGNEVAKSSDHFTTSLINADGNKNILDMTFTKLFPELKVGSKWSSEFKILKDVGKKDDSVQYDPTKYITYPTDDTLYEIVDNKTGSLKFDGAGALIEANIPVLDNEGTKVTLSLGTPLNPKIPNSGYDGVTAVKGLSSETKVISNDGKDEGLLHDYKIHPDGNIVATFTNGDSASVGKIAIYHFRNEQGLQKINANMFIQSNNSGKAFFYSNDGKYINGDRILTKKIENSNVQTSVAMSELIIMQKAFDANAKSITTSDQMIQRAINMKR